MAHIIRVYYTDRIYSIDLSMQNGASIGSGNSDVLRLDAHGLSDNHVKFINSGRGWSIKAKRGLCRENSRISSENLFSGTTYELETQPPVYISIHPKQADSEECVRLDLLNELNIGRDTRNDIVFSNMRTSSKHCQIYKTAGGYMIRDCGSKNGTFVNGKRISEKILNNGDIVNISVYQLTFANNVLSFYNVGDDITFKVPTERKEEVLIRGNSKTAELEECRQSGTISMFENDNGIVEHKKGTVSVFEF